jgi:soluble lytic murein transglycosylase-like protein
MARMSNSILRRLPCLLTLGLSALLAFPIMATADVYVKYLNGVPYFTDSPRAEGFKKVRTYSGRFRRIQQRLVSRAKLQRYSPTVHAAARSQGLDPALVFAIIKAESDFDPYAISSRGAMGLMQLRPETAYRMGVGDILDPRENIEGGARYLKFLLGLFDGDLDLSLAAYNAGEEAVEKYGDIPPYEETQTYVRRVQRYYRQYRGRAR